MDRESLRGKVVVITGRFAWCTRTELRVKLERLGAVVRSDVSSRTDLLVVGNQPGSKLERAQEEGIALLEEPELFELLGAEEDTATASPTVEVDEVNGLAPVEELRSLVERVMRDLTADLLEAGLEPTLLGPQGVLSSLVRALEARRGQQAARLLLDVWTGRRSPTSAELEQYPSGYLPEPLPVAKRGEVDRLAQHLRVANSRAVYVDLGNFWPRETETRFSLPDLHSLEVEYCYVGPFSRGGEPYVRLLVGEHQVLLMVPEEKASYRPEGLDELRVSWETDLDDLTMLSFLFLVGEARLTKYEGGAHAVECNVDTLRAENKL